MKHISKTLVIAFAASSLFLFACNNAPEPKAEAVPDAKADTLMLAEGEKIIYQCPMDPEVKSDKPAKCPKCGMDLERTVVKDTTKVK